MSDTHSETPAPVSSTLSRSVVLRAPVRSIENLIASLPLEDLDELENYLKSVILQRRREIEKQRVMNDDAPLVKLPTEILLEIGRLLLNGPSKNFFWSNSGLEGSVRSTFKPVLPFLQTCSPLRAKLHLLRHERLLLRCQSFRFDQRRSGDLVKALTGVASQLHNFSGSDVHRGPVAVLISPMTLALPINPRRSPLIRKFSYKPSLITLCPSTAAAMAGYAECLAYGRLQEPPVVYVRTDHVGHSAIFTCADRYTSHLRERGTIEHTYMEHTYTNQQNVFKTLGADESKILWRILEKGANEFKSVFEQHRCTWRAEAEVVAGTPTPITEDCVVQRLIERLT